MRLAVVRETRPGETRVALVPELVGKLTGLGYEVGVEPDAGEQAGFSDDDYVEAGATLVDDVVTGADVVSRSTRSTPTGSGCCARERPRSPSCRSPPPTTWSRSCATRA